MNCAAPSRSAAWALWSPSAADRATRTPTASPRIEARILAFCLEHPFYAELGLEVGAVLTDNGREFCGRPEQHPYELLLAVEDIEHRTTKNAQPPHQRLRRAHEPPLAAR